MLNYTRFGRHVYAIGGNEVAARVSGVNLGWTKLRIYAFSGLMAGIGGVVITARTQSATPALGIGYELDAIAAAVIGGTSFAGGIGTVWGTVVGALIIGVMNNGLDLLNVSPFYQQVVKGVIIIVAIVIDERKNR
jgi:inositol transport system permease protein